MEFELIVIWDTGEKDISPYDSFESAKKGESYMRMAFGNQISWTGMNYHHRCYRK